MKAMVIFITKKQKTNFENPNNQKQKNKTECHFPALPILNIFLQKFQRLVFG
jgi:hypothetical protein